jgi:2-methylcitrate dehydratase PrpD
MFFWSSIEPDVIADATLGALRSLVTVVVGNDFAARYPAHFGASVRLELTDGRSLTMAVPDALGDPENPLPPDRLRAKAEMLCAAAGMRADATARLLDAALALETDGPDPFLAALPREVGA